MPCSDRLPARILDQLASTWRLTDVLSRLSVDCGELSAPQARFAVMAAIKTCQRCRNGLQCSRWSSCHEEGERNPVPECCRAAALLVATLRCEP